MKAALLFVVALVAVAVVNGQSEESTNATIQGLVQLSTNAPIEGALQPVATFSSGVRQAAPSFTEENEDTICVQADNTYYLYANSLKLYSCYNLLPKVYVVKPKSLCKPTLSDCPKN
ncbi:uncharacterized protein LOC126236540 isoform X2 [Schistocerca nitens]|uniref:uncharacterized protein LOC126236540 isoform X2 n=1 Tax=Schistocerca nitens TaxID=7011 RepID=UPI002118E99B|nr:uncharacterized protein LOC126236540 isoform X2 [Schistocerca nitens]